MVELRAVEQRTHVSERGRLGEAAYYWIACSDVVRSVDHVEQVGGARVTTGHLEKGGRHGETEELPAEAGQAI